MQILLKEKKRKKITPPLFIKKKEKSEIQKRLRGIRQNPCHENFKRLRTIILKCSQWDQLVLSKARPDQSHLEVEYST